MFPQVMSAFNGWTTPVQLRVVESVAVDFQAVENVLDVVVFDAVVQPMKPQAVDRKPEGERAWRWLEMWSTDNVEPDSVVQDEAGVQYRIQSREDWSAGGFYHYEMTEKPV